MLICAPTVQVFISTHPHLIREYPVKFIKPLLIFSFICMILGVTTIFGFYYYLKPQLPDVATLKDVQLQTPMKVFSEDDKLIAPFGEKRRIPLEVR